MAVFKDQESRVPVATHDLRADARLQPPIPILGAQEFVGEGLAALSRQTDVGIAAHDESGPMFSGPGATFCAGVPLYLKSELPIRLGSRQAQEFVQLPQQSFRTMNLARDRQAGGRQDAQPQPRKRPHRSFQYRQSDLSAFAA